MKNNFFTLSDLIYHISLWDGLLTHACLYFLTLTQHYFTHFFHFLYFIYLLFSLLFLCLNLHADHRRCLSLNSDFSARSRVRGYLELYHAFLHDVVIPNANLVAAGENANEDRDWEIINNEPRVESPAQVNKKKQLITKKKHNCNECKGVFCGFFTGTAEPSTTRLGRTPRCEW